MALLMLEIAVARILSVALFSHFAFVAISLAMFGTGLSSLAVYLLPDVFRAERVDRHVVTFAACFGVAALCAVVGFLRLHVDQTVSLAGFLSLGYAYLLLAVPFFFGGLCVALLMTHFSAQIARVYWADLVGASLGCLAVVLALSLRPAPQVAALVGLLAVSVALGLSLAGQRARLGFAAAAWVLVAGGLVAAFSSDALQLRYVKSWTKPYAQREHWNAFSRVAAFPSEQNAAQLVPLPQPFDAYPDGFYPDSMNLDIDGAAWTPMMHFDGNMSSVQFLRETVLYLVHHLRHPASVLIIGTGGGRDVLAAKVFEQPSVLGLEINPLMRTMVQEDFADYSGRIYTLPGVEVVIDEARSRLSTLDRRFDVIQLSLIDTFSLNAAGGFVFSENYLYTQEGFQEYFRHLTDDGILTVTRYFTRQYALEMLRVLTMTRRAWEAEGATDVPGSIVVAVQGNSATMLAKRRPFTAAELEVVQRVADANGMQILYMPGADSDAAELAAVVRDPNLDALLDAYPYLIDPPTDDRPFFFHFLRGRLAEADVPDIHEDAFQFMRKWNDAVKLLYLLIGIVVLLAVLFFIVPLLVLARRQRRRVPPLTAGVLLLYFACLGYGFMMIEIPLLQRFVLLLGYPVYALAVVLFGLLLFSGTGSLISARFTRHAPALFAVLAGIVALAGVYVVVLPPLIAAAVGYSIGIRIAITVALLAPLGLLLGMAYPLGITLLRRFDDGLVPWAWGLNGALSVVASVLAIVIGSRVGFSAAFLSGVGTYVVAAAAMGLALRLRRSV
jgi:spermidine synthase